MNGKIKKDELRKVWIKNHNVEARFANIELLLVAITVCDLQFVVCNIQKQKQLTWSFFPPGIEPQENQSAV